MSFNRLKIGLLVLLTGTASAQTVAPRQNLDDLRPVVEQFLTIQAAGLPGKAEIKVGAIDKRLNLAACTAPQAFFNNGARAWGKTSVGIRCTAPTPWTIYVPAYVQIHNEYVVAAVPMPQGHVIQQSDLALIKGDLTKLPAGILTNTDMAVGKTVSRSLSLGAPLRPESMQSQKVVQQGQTVRLIASGPGFQISSEGRALNNATQGQVAQARTSSGQVLRGIAREGGIIELSF